MNEVVDIKKLRPYSKNPRKHPKKQIDFLVQQIKKNGFIEPILITKDYEIVAGHGRLLAAQKLGWTECHIGKGMAKPGENFMTASIIDYLTPEEIRQLRLTHNRAHDLGDYDREFFMEEVQWAVALGVSLPDLGLDSDFLGVTKKTADDIPEVPVNPISKYGEIYQLGKHRLMCGDSTKAKDVEALLDGQTANMVFTDPPYNVDYTGGMGAKNKNERKGILNDKMSKSQFYDFLSKVCLNLNTYCTGGIYICMSSSELDTLKRAFENTGGHWQTFIIWVKSHWTLSRADYQHTYEPILYGWPQKIVNHYFINQRTLPNVWEDFRDLKTEFDGACTLIKFKGYEVKIHGKPKDAWVKHKDAVTNIWRYDKPVKSPLHPTMKPVELCAKAIKYSSRQDDIVLDLFGGGGQYANRMRGTWKAMLHDGTRPEVCRCYNSAMV